MLNSDQEDELVKKFDGSEDFVIDIDNMSAAERRKFRRTMEGFSLGDGFGFLQSQKTKQGRGYPQKRHPCGWGVVGRSFLLLGGGVDGLMAWWVGGVVG